MNEFNYDNIMYNITSTLQEFSNKVNQLMLPIYEAFKEFDFGKILNSEAMLNLKYLYKVEELKWPLFCEDDNEFRKYILSSIEKREDMEEYIIKYYSFDKLNNVINTWKSNDIINNERFAILEESVQAYSRDMFFSCTALCMCQMMGIITDYYNYCVKLNIIDNKMIKNFLKELDMEGVRVNSEKAQLLGVVGVQEYGAFMWHYMFKYFREIVLSSKTDIETMENQVQRHKICHGEQINFGTQKHALKALLCIDMLMVLGVCIKCSANADKE